MRMPSTPAVHVDSKKIKAHLQTHRHNVNGIALVLSLAAMASGLVWLVWILWTTLSLDVGGLSMSLLTEMTPAPDTLGDSLADAIAGSLLPVGMATLIGTPLDILAGIYLAEYGKTLMLASVTRFISNILLSAPSIVIGLFVYAVVVVRVQHLSSIVGVTALALLRIPIVACMTENMLNLVPNAMREAVMAFGTPRWKVVLSIALKVSYAGVITGVLLVVARIAGETMPLLFTALNNQFWDLGLNQPMTTLPTVIFKLAMSPSPEWQQLVWAEVFLITLGVLGLSVLTRVLFIKR